MLIYCLIFIVYWENEIISIYSRDNRTCIIVPIFLEVESSHNEYKIIVLSKNKWQTTSKLFSINCFIFFFVPVMVATSLCGLVCRVYRARYPNNTLNGFLSRYLHGFILLLKAGIFFLIYFNPWSGWCRGLFHILQSFLKNLPQIFPP